MSEHNYLPDDKRIEFEQEAKILWDKWYNLEKSFHDDFNQICIGIKVHIQNPIIFDDRKEAIQGMRDSIEHISDLENKIRKMKELAKQTIQLATKLLPEK